VDPAGPRALLDVLDDASCPYELIPHPHTENALEEAEAIGVDAFHVAKTVVLKTPDGFVRAVVPATQRVDLHKAREVLETSHVELATEESLARAYPEFELGAVPPFGGSRGDRVLIDGRICVSPFVVVEAGTHEQSVKLKTTDLVALTGALLADLCEERSA
jgi:Ala-tRNA(Pro) deacylase